LLRGIQVNEGKNIIYNNVTLTAASTSSNDAKNTDGWDTYRSDQVTIENSVINNGDDCVSFKPSTPSSRPMHDRAVLINATHRLNEHFRV
jgi:polygalacturonase